MKVMSEQFAEWLKREMPAGTVINDPQWWAPRILKAVLTASAEPVAIANKGRAAFWVKWTDAAKDLYGPDIKLYTAPGALQAEIDRLKECLKRANDGFEEFERKYYLAMEERDALKANADRYRWARKPENGNAMLSIISDGSAGANMDRDIDAARSANNE